jgi:hypothetical protein
MLGDARGTDAKEAGLGSTPLAAAPRRAGGLRLAAPPCRRQALRSHAYAIRSQAAALFPTPAAIAIMRKHEGEAP